MTDQPPITIEAVRTKVWAALSLIYYDRYQGGVRGLGEAEDAIMSGRISDLITALAEAQAENEALKNAHRHTEIDACRSAGIANAAQADATESRRLNVEANDMLLKFEGKFLAAQKRIGELTDALRTVDATLKVPAAEYVPAITDAWKIIDQALMAANPPQGEQP